MAVDVAAAVGVVATDWVGAGDVVVVVVAVLLGAGDVVAELFGAVVGFTTVPGSGPVGSGGGVRPFRARLTCMIWPFSRS